MNMQLIWDGLKAMILGMGMVYVFLVIMIWLMNITSKILKPYAGFLEPKKNTPKAKRKPAPASAFSDSQLAAAAVDAVKLYRNSSHHGQSASIGVSCAGKTITAQVTPAGATPACPVSPAVQTTAPKQEPAPATGTAEIREIRSPLPGTVMRIEVSEGDTIAAGDVLAVIEAMKMETEIRAESAGQVREILVSTKDVVAPEQVLLLLEVTK